MALGNLILQVVLVLGVAVAFCLARRRKLRRHCLLMRVLIGVEVASIIVSMTRPMLDYVRQPPPLRLLTTETIVHHSLGLLVILMFIYVNLVFEHTIKTRWGFKNIMRIAAVLWVVTLVLGIHLYVRLYS